MVKIVVRENALQTVCLRTLKVIQGHSEMALSDPTYWLPVVTVHASLSSTCISILHRLSTYVIVCNLEQSLY